MFQLTMSLCNQNTSLIVVALNLFNGCEDEFLDTRHIRDLEDQDSYTIFKFMYIFKFQKCMIRKNTP